MESNAPFSYLDVKKIDKGLTEYKYKIKIHIGSSLVCEIIERLKLKNKTIASTGFSLKGNDPINRLKIINKGYSYLIYANLVNIDIN